MENLFLPHEVDRKPGEAMIKFCIDRRINKEKTEGKKYAVYENYIALNACTDLRQNVFDEATDEHKEEYPKQWATFEASDEYDDFVRQQETSDPGDSGKELREAKAKETAEADDLVNNTPLDQLNGIGPALSQTLNAAGVHSIQQLADKKQGDLPEIRGRLSAEQLIARARTYVTTHDVSGRG